MSNEEQQAPSFGYVRIVTLRGLVVDLALSLDFQRWLKDVRGDGMVLSNLGAIPYHAIDSIQFSRTPFQPMLGSVPMAGNA